MDMTVNYGFLLEIAMLIGPFLYLSPVFSRIRKYLLQEKGKNKKIVEERTKSQKGAVGLLLKNLHLTPKFRF